MEQEDRMTFVCKLEKTKMIDQHVESKMSEIVSGFSSSSQAITNRYILWIFTYLFSAIFLDLCLEFPFSPIKYCTRLTEPKNNSFKNI